MNLLSGFRAWFWQRLSALYLALFFLYALASLALSPPQGFEA
ncbi:MAG: succinate dehydrogenase, hydrophobic membrane anchor protein, partial [Gammaproteobacteria bacterium]